MLGESPEEKHEVLPEKKPKKKVQPKVEPQKEESEEEETSEVENEQEEVEIGQEEPLESVGLSAPSNDDDEYIRFVKHSLPTMELFSKGYSRWSEGQKD